MVVVATLVTDADHRSAVDPVVVVPAVTASLINNRKTDNSSIRSSHVMIAGRSRNVPLATMAAHLTAVQEPVATETTTIAAEAAADTIVAGRRAVAAGTSTTQNWEHATSVWRQSSLGWAIRVSILTNTRIYPWRRRAKMSHLISHRSMTCS